MLGEGIVPGEAGTEAVVAVVRRVKDGMCAAVMLVGSRGTIKTVLTGVQKHPKVED